MKVLLINLVLCFLLGCTADHRLVELDQQSIFEIGANAVTNERPYLSMSDLVLIRVNYSFECREYSLKQAAGKNPCSTEFLRATLRIRPTATVIRGSSGSGEEFSACWHQEASVEIHSNTVTRVRFLTQGHDGQSQHPNYATVFEGDQLWNMLEEVFRHIFYNNASASPQRAPTFFVSVFRRDPPEEFLNRVADIGKPVLPGSSFDEGEGLKLYVKSITCLEDDSVSVEAGYYAGNLSSSLNTLILTRKNGKWTVMSMRQDIIS